MMRQMRSNEEGGWILIEAVLLGLVVVAAAAVLGMFARTALLAEYAAARMEAAFVARAQFSRMEAELDQGVPPTETVTAVTSNDRIYHVDADVGRAGNFYDVRLTLSWQVLGHEEQACFVRRMRRHVESSP